MFQANQRSYLKWYETLKTKISNEAFTPITLNEINQKTSINLKTRVKIPTQIILITNSFSISWFRNYLIFLVRAIGDGVRISLYTDERGPESLGVRDVLDFSTADTVSLALPLGVAITELETDELGVCWTPPIVDRVVEFFFFSVDFCLRGRPLFPFAIAGAEKLQVKRERRSYSN